MEIYLFEIASRAAGVLLSPGLLVPAALAGLALATGAAGRVAIRIEDVLNGAATTQQPNEN